MNALHRSESLQAQCSALSRVRKLLPLVGICSFLLYIAACGGARSGIGTPSPIQHTVTLSWYANYPPVAGYNIYRGMAHGGPYSDRLNSSLEATTSFNDSTVQTGTKYYYVVTAVDAQNQESDYSAEVEVAIPSS